MEICENFIVYFQKILPSPFPRVAAVVGRAPWRPQGRFESIRWWGAACRPPNAACCPSIAWEFLRLIMLLPSPASGTCVSVEEDEEILGGNCLLWTGVREIPPASEELWHLAALWLPQQHPQHGPGVPGSDHRRRRHPVLPRHGRLAPSPGPLNPDHEGGGDHSQQVPWLQDPWPHRVLRRQHKPRFTTKRPNTFF